MIKQYVKNIITRFPVTVEKNLYLTWHILKNINKVFEAPIRAKKNPTSKNIRLVGFLKVHNEEVTGNLERVLSHMKKFCDEIVVCDCNSTDKSVEVAKKFTTHILNEPNQFEEEIFVKQKMLDYALKLNPDWIVWLDADEVFDRNGEQSEIRDLCAYGNNEGIDGFSFLEHNLWKSELFYRVDEFWNRGWYVRLWKNNGNLNFKPINGLHLTQHPFGLKKIKRAATKVIHFGFTSSKLIDEKYRRYKSHGQSGYMKLERFYNEAGIRLKPVELSWFPFIALPRKALIDSIDHTTSEVELWLKNLRKDTESRIYRIKKFRFKYFIFLLSRVKSFDIKTRTCLASDFTYRLPEFFYFLFFGFFIDPAEPRLAKFIIKNLKENAVFFDIGANCGFYSILANSLSAHVHSFEPTPKIYGILKKNLSPGSNIRAMNCALSNSDGESDFYLSLVKFSSVANSLNKMEGSGSKKIKVKTIMLDTYCRENRVVPDFLKIDVEGAEALVIEGGIEILKNNNPIISMEFLPMESQSYERILNSLSNLRYRAFVINESGDLDPLSNIQPVLGLNLIFKKY